MNTKICYLYRDAGNYKVHNECVIQGELSKEQIQSILDCCDMGEYFIPRQVGMPERRFDEYDTEVDHCWFEISEDGFERTNQPANIPLTPRQLVENFALRIEMSYHLEYCPSCNQGGASGMGSVFSLLGCNIYDDHLHQENAGVPENPSEPDATKEQTEDVTSDLVMR